MRDTLAPLEGTRHQFRAIYIQTGVNTSSAQITALLGTLTDEDGAHCHADHVWAAVDDRFFATGVLPGERIAFTAVVYRYRHGGDYSEFGIRGLRRVKILDRAIGQRAKGGMDVPAVDPTADIAVARADRPGGAGRAAEEPRDPRHPRRSRRRLGHARRAARRHRAGPALDRAHRRRARRS